MAGNRLTDHFIRVIKSIMTLNLLIDHFIRVIMSICSS